MVIATVNSDARQSNRYSSRRAFEILWYQSNTPLNGLSGTHVLHCTAIDENIVSQASTTHVPASQDVHGTCLSYFKYRSQQRITYRILYIVCISAYMKWNF